MNRTFISLLFLVLFTQDLTAQEGYELGLWVGASQYFGDLNTANQISSPGLAAGIIGRKNYNERVSLSAQIAYGRISAADSLSNNSFQQNRNLSFRSNVWDFSTTLEFNFFPYIHGSYDYFYTPYIFGGIGLSKFNPQAELDGVWYDLRDLGTEGQADGNEYGLVAFTFVYGAGFKVDLNRDFSLNIFVSGRRVTSDYVDDVSTRYPDQNLLLATRGPISAALSDRSNNPDFVRPGLQRGNQKDSDYYYFLSIGIVKYFGDIKCPPISKIQE